MAKKEKITPPSKRELKAASKDLHKKDPAGARVMAAEGVAKRQGAKRKPR